MASWLLNQFTTWLITVSKGQEAAFLLLLFLDEGNVCNKNIITMKHWSAAARPWAKTSCLPDVRQHVFLVQKNENLWCKLTVPWGLTWNVPNEMFPSFLSLLLPLSLSHWEKRKERNHWSWRGKAVNIFFYGLISIEYMFKRISKL